MNSTRDRLSQQVGASFIALLPKNVRADNIKNFCPISLIRSIYRIFAKVLASDLQVVLASLISFEQGTFAHERKILDKVLIANECIHYIFKKRKPCLPVS
eukprot:TRINITY_DN14578_c1_g1_i1.p1 TRINITY_DN14578_c1_g1~~TRINITY_DN14578_c1_g1_i1.p1  ORF type:complete len:100 (-),score=10.09 TRINITY_DN14578_c1_g1_i1:877-1176(-)